MIVTVPAAIRIFRGKHYFLSNFYTAEVEYEGVIYRTLEHAYQAAKFFDPAAAGKYLNAPDYPDILCAALLEMHRQVGVLEIEHSVARRGLLIRHLVMPGYRQDSIVIVEWIAEKAIDLDLVACLPVASFEFWPASLVQAVQQIDE